MDDQQDLSSSLLRRLLHQDQPPHTLEGDLPDPAPAEPAPDRLRSPRPSAVTPPPETIPRAPIRPAIAETGGLAATPLTPTPPPAPAERPLTLREQMQRAEEALIELREKMAAAAAQFAEGELNQAQFEAIYARYSEQRDITERLLARDPSSQAWESVVRPGYTQFLKQQYAARLLSYAIYEHASARQIALTGTLQLRPDQVRAVIQRLQTVRGQRGSPGPAQRSLPDGRCVVFVPGELTSAAAIFSLQPSGGQVARLVDIHRDFERANRRALHSQDVQPDRLVFPHRALFETE